MARAPGAGPAQDTGPRKRVAGSGRIGTGHPTFAASAARLLDNGFEPLPIRSAEKIPAVSRWSTIPIDADQLQRWSGPFGQCGIGLRTGRLVGIDIDVLDPDLAHQIAARAMTHFGSTLMRVGLWPKRLLLFRTETPFPKMKIPRIEILGAGQQFVAFGIHPVTGQPYQWPTGETPLDVPIDDLPLADGESCTAFLAEAASLIGQVADERRLPRERLAAGAFRNGPRRHADGLVVDGRDGWLSTIAFHTVQDATETGEPLDPQHLAERVWARFLATTDLARNRKDGLAAWSPADAARKVRDKLALQATGRLPERRMPYLQPEDPGDLLPADVARARLTDAIGATLKNASNWWSGDRDTAAPVVGIRATVGLGKSAIARDRIADWQRRMAAQGLPHRVLVLTPSHRLAEEAAAAWAAKVDGPVAVLRGYEARDPVTGGPMCHDPQMVKFALREGLRVGKSVCRASSTWQCPHYQGCAKQQNRKDVAAAKVVLAPYDVLFSGLGAGPEPFGLLVIDEGCWQRSTCSLNGPPIELLGSVGLSAGLSVDDPAAAAAMADLAELRAKAKEALTSNGPGRVLGSVLRDAGLTAEACAVAAGLEERCRRDSEIYPGMKRSARTAAIATVKRNETARRLAAIWREMAHIIGGSGGTSGLLRVARPHAETGQQRLVLHRHPCLHDSLAGLPILHLDATLRPELAGTILPRLEVIRIDAAQPHQHLTLVVGRFGKTTLCPTADLPEDERCRRQNRLREVVDYVRWQARRVGSRGVLVVTHQIIEPAFAGIGHVVTAHFNAIAGLDQYRDVGLLIVVGRPLPSSAALTPIGASLFHDLVEGRYRPDLRAVRMRTGKSAVVRVARHESEQADLLRAAICDDELIQAIGRGRGVNRTADEPFEVHLLADVALPLIHDHVVPWEAVVPDPVQRMLLAGVAVDSPADAATLHPDLFGNGKQAQKLLERSGFERQNPMSNTYREMSLKCARYRRSGRGRSWQLAWWLDGDTEIVRTRLQTVLGKLDGWEPVA